LVSSFLFNQTNKKTTLSMMMRKASRRSNDDDDDDDDNHHHRIKSHLIRPVPVRIETQRLYDSAAANGLNTAQVHAALEWQRQWTTYEPHSDSDNYQPQQSSFLLMNDIMDHREQGARNPSPGKSVETDDDEDEDDDNDAPIIFVPKPKRSRDHHTNNHNHGWIPEDNNDDDDDDDHVSDLSASPPGLDVSHSPPGFFTAPRADAPDVTAIARPVAIRANDNTNRLNAAAGPPPAIIENDDGNEVPERSLSPLTLYSSSQHGSTSHHHQQPGSNSHPPSCLGGMMVSCATTSLMTSTDSSSGHSETKLSIAREGLLNALASSDGDADDEDFQKCLSILEYSNVLPQQQQQQHSSSNKGMWLSLTKPTFFGCLGTNEEGDPLYTLARMSFDMFTPGDLVCSLQGVFNEVTDVSDLARSDLVIPKSLVDEARDRRTSLQTYTYVVCCLAFVSSDPHTFGGMSHPLVRLFDLFSLSYLLQHYHCLYH
jgi:hypothetical protein